MTPKQRIEAGKALARSLGIYQMVEGIARSGELTEDGCVRVADGKKFCLRGRAPYAQVIAEDGTSLFLSTSDVVETFRNGPWVQRAQALYRVIQKEAAHKQLEEEDNRLALAADQYFGPWPDDGSEEGEVVPQWAQALADWVRRSMTDDGWTLSYCGREYRQMTDGYHKYGQVVRFTVSWLQEKESA